VALAIFDLDNTLLAGDSDYLWGCFLAEQGIVDGERYEQENARFYRQYQEGVLDIHEWLAFQLHPLTQHDNTELEALRARFIDDKIRPIVLPAARELVGRHRGQGDALLIITATNSFITRPIAALFDIPYLLATEPRILAGRFTGEVDGTPCFREGKVVRLRAWLAEHMLGLGGSWFYSDSHNDIPLLELVTHPVAVDPDPRLTRHAEARAWPIITLR
jgi:HAD superfamily hydrolase (TIGR01490 family)